MIEKTLLDLPEEHLVLGVVRQIETDVHLFLSAQPTRQFLAQRQGLFMEVRAEKCRAQKFAGGRYC